MKSEEALKILQAWKNTSVLLRAFWSMGAKRSPEFASMFFKGRLFNDPKVEGAICLAGDDGLMAVFGLGPTDDVVLIGAGSDAVLVKFASGAYLDLVID